MAKQKKAAGQQQTGKKKPRGRPFSKGQSGNPDGRKPGVPNKVTVEAREAASEIVDNPAYRAKLVERALAGKLPPQIEAMLWAYAKGKPKETLELSGPDAGPLTVSWLDKPPATGG